MAVTLQLVRLPEATLAACSVSEATLNELISFHLSRPEAKLDLDWAPHSLEILFARGTSVRQQSALRLALEGESDVNADYPLGPRSYPVYNFLRCLRATTVRQVADVLETVDCKTLLAGIPADTRTAAEQLSLGAWDCHPRDYLGPLLLALVAFYAHTAALDQCVAMWWD